MTTLVERLGSLHKGTRGSWVYQSPRVLFLLLYAEVKGLDPSDLLQRHLAYVKRIGPQMAWLAERLKWLGYETRGGREPDPHKSMEYAKRLGLDPGEVAATVEALLKVLKARGPEDAAYLPPALALPEKALLLDAAAQSQAFNLRGTLRLLAKLAQGEEVEVGDPASFRRELRFRHAYLYALHLAAAERRPTCLGYALALHLDMGHPPLPTYFSLLRATGRLRYVVALEALALGVGTREDLDALLDVYEKLLNKRGVALPPREEIYTAFVGMRSDIGVGMIAPAKPLEDLLMLIET